MRSVNKNELGLMFWGGTNASESISFVRQFGLSAGQLGFSGELPLHEINESWRNTLDDNPDFAIPTAVCSYFGEDYGNIGLVLQTVGLVPEGTRAERVGRTKRVADIAAELGIPSVACHIGFIPGDRDSPGYGAVRDVAREICDYIARHGQTFALETGQEPAHELLQFLHDVDRPNIKVNFDPANMILYGTGDPVEALKILGPHVVSVHCKDGEWPPVDQPGALGAERKLGAGAVDFPQFLQTLEASGYTGILSIEREELNAERRVADIHHAVSFLSSLLTVHSGIPC